jgi:hypothetical protein
MRRARVSPAPCFSSWPAMGFSELREDEIANASQRPASHPLHPYMHFRSGILCVRSSIFDDRPANFLKLPPHIYQSRSGCFWPGVPQKFLWKSAVFCGKPAGAENLYAPADAALRFFPLTCICKLMPPKNNLSSRFFGKLREHPLTPLYVLQGVFFRQGFGRFNDFLIWGLELPKSALHIG